MWRNVSKKSQLNDPSRRWFQDLTFFPKRTSLRPGIPPASFLLVLPFPTMSLFLLRLSGLFLLKSWHFWSPAPPITVGLLHRQQTMPSWPPFLCCVHRGVGGPGVWEACLCKEHNTLAQVYLLWGLDTVDIQVKRQDLYSARLCIQALRRQAVWSQASLVPFLNLNFLICKVDTNASCCSVAQSCPTLCDLMDCSTPGFPVLHYLLEFVQTHVHWVNYVIQPSHPLSSPSPPSFNLSQHQCLFPMSRLFASSGQSIGASASASVLLMNIQCWFPLGLTGLISLQPKGFSRVFSSTTVWKNQFFGTQPFFMVQFSHPKMKPLALARQTFVVFWLYKHLWYQC